MSEVKKCPKCGGVMVRSNLYTTGMDTEARLVKAGDSYRYSTDIVTPFHCEHCGYIELYRETRTRG